MNLLKNFLVNLTNYKYKNRSFYSQFNDPRNRIELLEDFQNRFHDYARNREYMTMAGDEEPNQQSLKPNVHLNCHDLKRSCYIDDGLEDDDEHEYGNDHADDHGSNMNSLQPSNNPLFGQPKQPNRSHIHHKSWGNFVNVYDDDGNAKLFIDGNELSNYLILKNFHDPDSPFTIIASLFPLGNYPKQLYSSTDSEWRMRYNIFTSGMPRPSIINDNDCKANEGDHHLLHLGELHLYFHIEPFRKDLLYQNLCFFFDESLHQLFNLKNQSYADLLKKCLNHLRQELSGSSFVEQLFFPIGRNRFNSIEGKHLDYFELKQYELYAAIDSIRKLYSNQ